MLKILGTTESEPYGKCFYHGHSGLRDLPASSIVCSGIFPHISSIAVLGCLCVAGFLKWCVWIMLTKMCIHFFQHLTTVAFPLCRFVYLLGKPGQYKMQNTILSWLWAEAVKEGSKLNARIVQSSSFFIHHVHGVVNPKSIILGDTE